MTESPEPARLTIDDLLDLQQVSDAQIPAQGDRVAYVVADNASAHHERKPASRVWLVDIESPSPRPLTAAGTRAHSPRWSPDGASIAFLGNRDPQGPDQLFVLGESPGEAVQITSGRAGVSAFSWTPDGRGLIAAIPDSAPEGEEAERAAGRDWLLYEDTSRLTRLWRIDATTAERAPIAHGDLHVWEFAISPDGAAVVALVSESPHNWAWYAARLARIDLASGNVETLLAGDWQMTRPAWSSDGRHVAVIVSAFSDQGMTGGDVMVVGLDGIARNISDGHPRSYLSVEWVDDTHLLCSAIDDGELSIGRLRQDGQYHELWRGERGITRWTGPILSVATTATGLRIAAVLSSPDVPADVHLATEHDGGLTWQQLTHENPSVRGKLMPRPEVVRWQSIDGTDIQGLLLQPEKTTNEPLPTVVLIHGGPTALWGFDFMGTRSMGWVQLLVTAGYAVFLPNPRGSMGWGRAFAEANVGDMGGGDFVDILSGVEMLVEQGIADPNRLGVGGWSYGGYLTAWAITQTNRFRAAVAGASITNWISFHGGSTIQAFDQVFYQDDPFGWDGRYGQFSPMAHVRNTQTPTLFLHGEKDPICPVGQAYEMWRALRECGVETQLAVYPREGHGPIEREHLRDVLERGVRWLTERV